MNLLLALEQLGYENGTDFEVRWVDTEHVIAVWNHTDPQPDQTALDAAWAIVESNYAMPLDDMKALGKVQIDEMAGVIRTKFITVAPGQEMTYIEKAEEAADFVSAGYPADTSNYPFVQAEMAATGMSKEDAADAILAQKSAWITAGALIERHRLTGKSQIDAETTQAGIDSVVESTKSLLDAV